jgi:hypothetical protein
VRISGSSHYHGVESKRIPRLPEVGEGTLAVLRRAGVRTARDVLAYKGKLRRLPGIGPGREAVLLEWAEENLTEADLAYFAKLRQQVMRTRQQVMRTWPAKVRHP